MVDYILKDLRLSNLNGKKIRDTKCLLYMDENCGPNNIEEYKIKNERMKCALRINKNVLEKPFYNNIADEKFHKCNDIHENRLPQPYRDYENIVDPTSHFLTPGHNKSGSHIGSIVRTNPITENSPQTINPSEVNSDRKSCASVFVDIDRSSENDPKTLQYNSRDKSVDACRAGLRAMNQAKLVENLAPNMTSSTLIHLSDAFPEFISKKTPLATEEDINALKYVYTSTTQKSYEDVPFDSYLHPRRWAPLVTKEAPGDPIRAAYSKSKYYPPVDQWKGGEDINNVEGRQLRPNHFLSKLPHDFCSPYPREKQIPSYSGCVGAYNKEDIDNPYVKDFKPFHILRNEVPKFGKCVEKPVFVGYTGKVQSLPGNRQTPFHTDPTIRNVLGQSC